MREFTRAVQCQNCKANWYEPENYEPRESCPHCPSDDLMLIGRNSELFRDEDGLDPREYEIGSDTGEQSDDLVDGGS